MKNIDIDFLVSKIWSSVIATYHNNIKKTQDNQAIIIESHWEKDCKILIENLLKAELKG